MLCAIFFLEMQVILLKQLLLLQLFWVFRYGND